MIVAERRGKVICRNTSMFKKINTQLALPIQMNSDYIKYADEGVSDSENDEIDELSERLDSTVLSDNEENSFQDSEENEVDIVVDNQSRYGRVRRRPEYLSEYELSSVTNS